MTARSVRRAHQRQGEHGLRRRDKLGAGAGAAVGATVLFAPSADAATFTVTTLADNGADGTLRQEIYDANATAGADTIVFQSGLSGTITLLGLAGDITIDDPLDIQGPGAGQVAVSGDDLFRIFDASASESLSISGLTLRNAYVNGVNGAALYADGTTTLSAMVFQDNHAGGGGGGDGGAASLEGDTTITGSTFTDNRADSGGGALYGGDAGDTWTISNSTFTGNVAATARGGALYSDEGTLVINDTTISGNSANYYGGGIFTDDGSVTISGSTVADNQVTVGNGGGVLLGTGDPGEQMRIEDTTLSGNRAPAGYGGGLLFDGRFTDADLTVSTSAFSGNTAEFGGGVYLYGTIGDTTITNTTISGNTAAAGGGGAWLEPDTGAVTIRNSTVASNTAFYAGGLFLDGDNPGPAPAALISSSIVADNTQTDPTPGYAGGDDIAQDSTSEGFAAGFSLIERPQATMIAESPAGSNIIGTDPGLGPLADNGGPTQTHLTALTSAAVDGGIANGLTTDQRGLTRPFDASDKANRPGSDGTDIGAVELVAEGKCKGKSATVLVARGQTITGSAQKDVIVGTSAKDKIRSGGGKDTVCAAAGNDKVKGQGGKDTLIGQAGKDRLSGGPGKDKLKGGPGKDILNGGPGKDKLKGGPGKDTERQ